MRYLVLLIACAALAAQPVDHSRAPEIPAVRAWKLPPVFETTLPNGLTVVMVDDSRVPLVTMRLVFAGGSRRDPKDLSGLAMGVADMLTHDTANRTFSQINESVDRMGGTLTVASGVDQMAIAGSVISENFAGLLEIVSDVARHSAFPELEVRLMRQDLRQTLARQRAQPGYMAGEGFRRAVFGDHPYGNIPTGDSIERIDRKALVSYRDTFLLPNNAFLILVGKLPARAQALKLVTEQFGTWVGKPLPEAVPATVPAPQRRLILVDRPGSLQADIHMGRIAAMQRDADYPAMIAAAIVFDSRERRGLAYGGRAEPAGFDEAGVFGVALQVKNDAVAEAMQGMIDRLARMAKEPVTAQELEEAKSAANASWLLRLESQAGVADALALLKVLHLTADFIESYTARMNLVNQDQVQQAAAKYLAPSDDAMVVWGDPAKIQQQLQKFGDVLKSR